MPASRRASELAVGKSNDIYIIYKVLKIKYTSVIHAFRFIFDEPFGFLLVPRRNDDIVYLGDSLPIKKMLLYAIVIKLHIKAFLSKFAEILTTKWLKIY
ncbi:hypothetical protein C4F40_07110 [Sphingobacterium sp. Ka21]|uniref:Uncharacterized protein n=1 Tax=Sphingobacterium pedocola TaxID=2082722 RepID=A0ABR9T6F1_9SPHI|nr:hypothetical protein [Sphingobacterium pedocola]